LRPSDYVYLAFTSLKEKRGRALGAVLGVTIAVVALSMALGVGESFQQVFVTELQKTLMANSILVTPGSTGTLTDADIAYLKRIPGVADVFGIAISQGRVYTEEGAKGVIIVGIDPRWLPYYLGVSSVRAALAAGDPTPRGLGVLVSYQMWMDTKTGRRLLDVGSTLPVQLPRGKSVTFYVVGLLEETSGFRMGPGVENRYIYMDPEAYFRYIAGGRRSYTFIVVVVGDLQHLDRITEQVRAIAPPGSRVFSPAAMARQMTMFVFALQAFMAVVSAVGMGITAMWIFDSMTISVVQRTKEIGILKALGYTSGDILVLFLMEAAIISAIGAGLGVALSAVAARIVYLPVFSLKLHPSFTPGIALISAGLPFLSDVAAAFIPSKRAAGLNPVEALRYE